MRCPWAAGINVVAIVLSIKLFHANAMEEQISLNQTLGFVKSVEKIQLGPGLIFVHTLPMPNQY